MGDKINPGDKVQWTQTSQRGRVMSMRLRDGVVESINGSIAVVTYGKRGRMTCHVRILSLAGQPTLIDQTVEAIREASRA